MYWMIQAKKDGKKKQKKQQKCVFLKGRCRGDEEDFHLTT